MKYMLISQAKIEVIKKILKKNRYKMKFKKNLWQMYKSRNKKVKHQRKDKFNNLIQTPRKMSLKLN
jgi:muramoyltetrapeptide carboxypeptidase LdcA involved in peptidoglycan recycling